MACEIRRTGVYPGTFDPPTIAHLAIARAAITQCSLSRLVLTISRRGADKAATSTEDVSERLDVIRRSLRHDLPHREELQGCEVSAALTDHDLLVDICAEFTADLLILGADKWQQIHETRFYGDDVAARNAAIRSLPPVAVAPRPGWTVPPGRQLAVPSAIAHISSTAARTGRTADMTPTAKVHSEETGRWSTR